MKGLGLIQVAFFFVQGFLWLDCFVSGISFFDFLTSLETDVLMIIFINGIFTLFSSLIKPITSFVNLDRCLL